ncbi:hypothetical protein OG599_09900 [Streptomyces sp. NBC_01335]|uniref:hypothetical protein n=1 Tax=Streptomyces sp. NBC_01335 TaxID=2903828 RepID=UPI002E10D3E4|nr:hypothetical protein OG599_09900 [Streptomyces sp. NBC_01335]
MADPLQPGAVGAPHQEHQEHRAHRAARTLGGRQLAALLPDPADGTHLRIPYTLEPGTLREAVHRMAAALADGLPAGPAGRRARWIV